MTPDKAGDLLAGTTPGPWFFDDDMDGRMHKIGPIVPAGTELECTTDDAALAAHAPDMAAMIAGMHEEWGVEVTHCRDGDLHTRWGYDDRKDAEAFARYMGRDPRWNAVRVVRRYVTEPEEA